MLNISPGAVKGTLGVGGLGILLLSISSLDKLLHMHFWVAFSICMLPAFIFLFAAPGMMPVKVARRAQRFAVCWYFTAASLSLYVAIYRGLSPADALSLAFVALGAWPCVAAWQSLHVGPDIES